MSKDELEVKLYCPKDASPHAKAFTQHFQETFPQAEHSDIGKQDVYRTVIQAVPKAE